MTIVSPSRTRTVFAVLGRVELGAEAERAARPELGEERLPLRDLLRARGLRLLGAHLLPGLDVLGVMLVSSATYFMTASSVAFALGST